MPEVNGTNMRMLYFHRKTNGQIHKSHEMYNVVVLSLFFLL